MDCTLEWALPRFDSLGGFLGLCRRRSAAHWTISTSCARLNLRHFPQILHVSSDIFVKLLNLLHLTGRMRRRRLLLQALLRILRLRNNRLGDHSTSYSLEKDVATVCTQRLKPQEALFKFLDSEVHLILLWRSLYPLSAFLLHLLLLGLTAHSQDVFYREFA